MKIEICNKGEVNFIYKSYEKFNSMVKMNNTICEAMGKGVELNPNELEKFNNEYDEALKSFGYTMYIAMKNGGLKYE